MATIKERTYRLCETLGIQYPIIQGGMAWVSDHNLVTAVSEGGGLGTIGAGQMPPDVLDKEILEVQTKTDKPFAVNMMLINSDVEKQMDVCIQRNVPVVILGAGNASSHVRRFNEHGTKVVGIAPSVALAKRFVKNDIDAIIVEGNEAGGHIGRFSTMTLLPAIVDALADEEYEIPVIAAGGICDGKTFVASLILGAYGAQIGTRFVVAEETNVHNDFKKAYIEANDVTKVTVTGQAWGLPAQCITNKLTKQIGSWEQEYIEEGRTKEKQLEIELRMVGALRKAISGDVDEGSVMAGQCVIRLREEHLNQPAAEIMEEILADARETLREIGEVI